MNEYSGRTIFRHLVISSVFLLLPFYLSLRNDHYNSSMLLSWLARNAFFFILWVLLLGGVAIFAHYFAQKLWIYRFIDNRPKTQGTLPFFVEKWGTCSKCVAYWFGGILTAIVHCIYWSGWIGFYFTPIGAAWAAVIAVSIYLYKEKE